MAIRTMGVFRHSGLVISDGKGGVILSCELHFSSINLVAVHLAGGNEGFTDPEPEFGLKKVNRGFWGFSGE